MDPFARLGVAPAFAIDLAELERVHRELSRALHPDRHLQSMPSERRRTLDEAVAVNEAWRILRDPLRRAEALLSLRGAQTDGPDAKPAPAFLMAMMERREELEAAKAKGLVALEALERDVAADLQACLDRLGEALDAGVARHGKPEKILAELRFHRRLLDELHELTADA
jgi:molecular chaperone HscB